MTSENIVSDDLGDFDIADYAGHTAFSELNEAYKVYIRPINNTVLAKPTNIQNIDIENFDYVRAPALGISIENLRKEEAKRCINAAIFFQAMMEAVVNNERSTTEKYFKEKWNNFLIRNEASEEIKQHFSDYHQNIYKDIRINAVHANTRIGSINMGKLRFPYLYENLMRGWFCFIFLLKHSDREALSSSLTQTRNNIDNDNYQKSWATMCDVHGMPSTIDNSQYPDLSEYARYLNKKNIDGSNNDLKGNPEKAVE